MKKIVTCLGILAVLFIFWFAFQPSTTTVPVEPTFHILKPEQKPSIPVVETYDCPGVGSCG